MPKIEQMIHWEQGTFVLSFMFLVLLIFKIWAKQVFSGYFKPDGGAQNLINLSTSWYVPISVFIAVAQILYHSEIMTSDRWMDGWMDKQFHSPTYAVHMWVNGKTTLIHYHLKLSCYSVIMYTLPIQDSLYICYEVLVFCLTCNENKLNAWFDQSWIACDNLLYFIC